MKKLLKCVLEVIGVCVVLLFLVGMFLDDEEIEEEKEEIVQEESNDKDSENENKESKADGTGDWVIYWYLCGSDLESEGAAATTDLQEMFDAKLQGNVTLVIETGGASEWQNDMMSADSNSIYEYNGGDLVCKKELGQRNMGDAETLKEFLTYCEDNYTAEHKMLLFWNHGGGSVNGVSFDENYDFDSLTLEELDTALKAVYQKKDQKLDVVGFDTCLMATVENANIMKNYADYMVASEETEPGNGWEYTGWLTKLSQNPDMDGAQLGKIICDTYMEGCEEEGTEEDVTLSVTDLSKVDQLVEVLNNMGQEILLQVQETSSAAGEFARCANKAENYGGNNDQEGYTNMVDLGDLARNAKNLLPDTEKAIENALKECVLYSVNGEYREHAKGLSIYYSYNGDQQELSQYQKIAAGETYPVLIQYLTGGNIQEEVFDDVDCSGLEEIDDFDSEITTSVDEDGYLTIQLDPWALDCVQSVTFNLAYLDEEANEIIYLGTDNDIEADWDTGLFRDNFRGVWGAIDGNLAYMEIYYEGEDYNLYSVPIRSNGEEYYMSVAYSYETGTYEIIGISQEIDPESGMADRSMYELEEGDEFVLLLYAMNLDDDSDDMYEYESEVITYTADTTFEETELFDGTYAFMFSVKDTRGNETTSDIAFLTYENGEIYADIE